MSARELFLVTEPEEVAAVLSTLRFGALVMHGREAFAFTAMPWTHEPGFLKGHMSRTNPQASAGDGGAMALFIGPNAYVTPNWYPAKAAHGKVVPTWNYEAVGVHGRVRFVEDRDWLLANVSALTERYEAERGQDWKVSDAPEEYVQRLLGGIVGVELAIEKVEVRRKFSQNRRPEDQDGVISGLLATGDANDRLLAESMQRHE